MPLSASLDLQRYSSKGGILYVCAYCTYYCCTYCTYCWTCFTYCCAYCGEKTSWPMGSEPLKNRTKRTSSCT